MADKGWESETDVRREIEKKWGKKVPEVVWDYISESGYVEEVIDQQTKKALNQALEKRKPSTTVSNENGRHTPRQRNQQNDRYTRIS